MSGWTDADEHGFNTHGYLAGQADMLVSMLVAWLATVDTGFDDDPVGPQVQLVVRAPDGAELCHADLDARHVRALTFDLRHGVAGRVNAARADARRAEMTRLLVQARQAGHDIGDVLADCLHAAAAKLYLGPARLVHGRPGSWEASIVMRWAEFDGVRPQWTGRDRLVELFRAMGEAKDDGGQVVSDALGHAARELGGIAALAEGSGWAHEVWNMAKSLNYDDSWEPY